MIVSMSVLTVKCKSYRDCEPLEPLVPIISPQSREDPEIQRAKDDDRGEHCVEVATMSKTEVRQQKIYRCVVGDVPCSGKSEPA